MRLLICVLTLSTACAAPTATEEEPLIIAKPVENSAPPAEPAAPTEPADKVVAMPLSSKALSSEMTGSLDRLLVTRVAADGTYDVISPSDIGSLLGIERLKDAAGCNDVACAADFAGALDARFVLYGVVDELGGRLNITLSLVDARDQRVHARSQVTVDKDETVYDQAIDAVVARLLGDTDAPTSIAAEPRREVFRRTVSEDPPVKLHAAATGSIFVDIPETFTGRPGWPGQKTGPTNRSTRDGEAMIIKRWTAVGFDALDRLVVGEPSLDKLKELGALYWVVGEVSATDNGSIMGTQMHAVRAAIAARVIEIATGKVVASAKESASAGHLDPEAGMRLAVDKAAKRAADVLLEELLEHLK